MIRLLTENTSVERDIAPPMRLAVTLPLEMDGRVTDVAVYVAASPFVFENRTTGAGLQHLAERIADLVNGKITEQQEALERIAEIAYAGHPDGRETRLTMIARYARAVLYPQRVGW